ncbi:MAG: MFS transporter [Francisellaceae bacterium]
MKNKDLSFNAIGTFIWVICALFFLYEFLLRTIIGTFQTPIMADLHLNALTFAIISSTAYQLAYGFMQLPVGFITARFGLKKTLTIAVVFCAVATFLFGLAFNFPIAVILRVLMGIGSAFGFVCLLVAVYDWMPHRHIALFIGLSQFIGTLGPMLAAGPLNAMAHDDHSNWRMIFFVIGASGIIIALLALAFVKNNRHKGGDAMSFKKVEIHEPVLKSLMKILSIRQTWFIALFSAFVYFAIEYLSENEGKLFLQLNGYSSGFSSYMITLSWLGYAIGCPVIGFISDRIKRRRTPMIFASILVIVALICIFYFTHIPLLLLISFFCLGLGASGQSIGFAAIAEQCQSQYIAAGLGFNNAMIMIIASIIAPTMGFILTHLAGGTHFTLHDYRLGFLFIVIFASLSLFMAVFGVKESFCKSQQEMHILG